VTVASVDIGSGKRDVIEAALDLDEAKQADDGGKLEADGDSSYFAVMNRDHLHFSLAPQRDGLLPVNNPQRLIRRVQKKRLLHI
jgi:hypothetical protein